MEKEVNAAMNQSAAVETEQLTKKHGTKRQSGGIMGKRGWQGKGAHWQQAADANHTKESFWAGRDITTG